MNKEQKKDMFLQCLKYCRDLTLKGKFKELDEMLTPLKAVLSAFSKDSLGDFTMRMNHSGSYPFINLWYGIDWDGMRYRFQASVVFYDYESAQERKRKYKQFINEVIAYLEGGVGHGE